MSLTCFDDLIGIKGECGTPTTPESGLWVQDITELHIGNFDKTITKEQNSGFEALQDIMGFASKEMAHDFRMGFMDKFDAKSIIENDVVGHWKKDLQQQPSEPTYLRGIHTYLESDPYMSLFISEIRVQSQTTGTVNVEVWDLTQNKLLDTIPVTSVAGEVSTAQVYKKYNTNKQRLDLFIGTDGGTDEMYQTNINIKQCCNKTSYRNGVGRFYGAKILDGGSMTAGNLMGMTGTAGVSITYSVSCDFDQWLCSQRHLLGIPFLYKIGEESMRDFKYAKRLNDIVTLHRADHTELMEYYNEKYQRSMEQIFSNLQVPNNVCFQCRKQVRTRISLP